jgi:DNA (cytosine-5)-methyltransferase 1
VRAVDLFAGWGGFTLGASWSGVDVVWAANHWPLAVAAHAANHPRAKHVCQDLRQANWTSLPGYDLLLAAPACQGHSTASQPGRRPYHDEMRATAWSVVDCADVTEPRALIVENVPAFLRWRLFPEWRAALVRLGYTITEHLVLASEHGAPQRRERLFVVGVRRPASIAAGMAAKARPELPFGPCIDWTAGGWRPVASTSPAVRERVRRSRVRLGGAERFLTQHTSDHMGVSLDEPIRTITTKDQWAVVDGDRYRPLTVRETARAMTFPDNYRWPAEATRRDCMTGLGNAVPPSLAADIVSTVAEAA